MSQKSVNEIMNVDITAGNFEIDEKGRAVYKENVAKRARGSKVTDRKEKQKTEKEIQE